MVTVKVTSKEMRYVLSELGWYWLRGIYRNPAVVVWKVLRYHRETGE